MDYFPKIKEILEDGIKKGAFPGGQFALVYDDKVYIHKFGVKSLFPPMLLKGDEVYDVASLTKVISTSTLAHICLEKGLFTLDTLVSDILKDYPNEIKIRDLMTHSSGLPAYLANANDLKTKEEVVKEVYKAKFVYAKNEKIVYSCVGFILLAYVIEKVLGDTIDKLAYKYIFKPLKMNNTNYHPDPLRAVPTEYRDDKVYQGLLVGKVHDGLSYAQGGLSGNAGLFSNVEDLSIFIRSIINDNFVLTSKQLALMFPSQIKKVDSEGDLINRSLGWAKPANDVDNIISHTGFTGCNMWIDRKRKIGFVLLTNAIHPKRENNKIFSYRLQIWNLFYK